MMNKRKPLTVYKASAGSGKTFALAVEYITLLVTKPDNYEYTLAVTFTNKATEEMKMRIISQLYGIWKQLDNSNSYLNAVMQKSGLSRQIVVENSGIALRNLLHHYNFFRVQTIDAFFQHILHNLAKELELTANLRIDLNDQQVEELAVDELIVSLSDNAQVLSWVRDFIKRNIENENSWNVIGNIKSFGMNIFNDSYKKHSRELDSLMKNEKFFASYTKLLQKKTDIIQDQLTSKAQKLYTLFNDSGYNDFAYYKYKGHGTIPSYIKKIKESQSFDSSPLPSRVQAFIDSPQRMISGEAPQEALILFAEKQLIPALLDFEESRQKGWFESQSAKLTLRNLNQLRLLHAIDSMVNDINKAANRFQLSNTQTLLHSLIKDTDTPFIFERIGSQLKHIMIDEFQDTSRIQWDNFKTLLLNCLSQQDSQSLIVGDVKQSIYRWRAGDWRLLNNIRDEFSHDQIAENPLNTNYRSEQKIVAFNNAFFVEAVKLTWDELKNDNIDDGRQLLQAYDYSELLQQPFQKDGNGYIHIELLPEAEYQEATMERVLNIIDKLTIQGVPAKEIAILVRTNGNISEIAERLMMERPSLRIVSDEAFRLDSSVAVNMLVLSLRLLVHPDDLLSFTSLTKLYHHHVLKDELDDNQLFIENPVQVGLPDAFFSDSRLRTLPFVDLVNHLYTLFSLSEIENQSAYICAFYDVVDNHIQEGGADIPSFLEEWDASYCQRTIQSDEADGLRIISIHKSKGLEFNHVIIPFCDWELEKNNLIWCERKAIDPYDKLPVIPVNFSKKKMLNTIYEEDYKEEHLQNVVDNMNLLYVAFTRASKSLFVIGKRMSKDKKKKKTSQNASSVNRSELLEETLPLLASSPHSPITCGDGVTLSLDGCQLSGLDDISLPVIFEWGDLDATCGQSTNAGPPTSNNKQENVFTQDELPHPIAIETFDNKVVFRQSNESKDFVNEEENGDGTTSYIQLGNILHQLFSTIRTLDDVPLRIRDLELKGILYDEGLTNEILRKKIEVAISIPSVEDWFSPKWKLYNECTILEKNPNTGAVREHRPDRVMTNDHETIVVDFKFGKPRPEYAEQVNRYCSLLTRMGHPSVKGYIWYVLDQHVEEVN